MSLTSNRVEVIAENRARKGLLPLCLSEAAERFS